MSKRYGRGRKRSAFTLIELLVSVMLLTISTLSLLTLWSLNRRVVESARDMGEYYAVARQEVERDKAAGFEKLFLNASGNAQVRAVWRTDYNADGRPLASGNWAVNAAATSGASYRAVSTYYLVKTGTETRALHQLGVQRVRVYRRAAATAPFEESDTFKVHESSAFYSNSQQWRHEL